MDYLKVDMILSGLQKGLSTLKITDQLCMNEQAVIEIKEIVLLSEYTRNHPLAPELKDFI